MAESSTADLMSGTEKENFDRLMSLFRTGTEIKQRLLEYYISKKELNLIDWLSVLSKNFLQFEDVKRAHRRSSTVQSIDLGDNTINTVFMCYCFDIFWDCCLLDTCLEGFLNIHKDELYRSYINSQKQTELPSVSSAPYSTCSTENSIPIITKDQWEFLYKNDENEKCLLASKGITVSCLDSYQNIFILSIVCSLFKALKAVSECQIEISKIAALQCFLTSNKFEEIWTKMKKNILTIGENCANSDIFQGKCARIRKTTYNRSLVQENRKYVLQEALNNPSFTRDRGFCKSVRKELDLITDEENLDLARKLCGTDISVTLTDGKYRKGSYSLSVIEKAENDLQKLSSLCSKQVISISQTETKEKTDTDDLQEGINKCNYLKLVQLITYIGKNVLVDVLKRRLPATNLGFAFNGMKNRILPVLNNHERQVLYPDNSYYEGNLSDLDISLLYTILRNLSTICPHKTGWGNMPTDDDKDMSANIERIRMFKNKYVSHHPTYSLNVETFLQTWTEISACIIELGGTEYIRKIDKLLTSEINPRLEKELFNTLERFKEANSQHELSMCKFKDVGRCGMSANETTLHPTDLDELKQQRFGITRSCATCQNSSADLDELEQQQNGITRSCATCQNFSGTVPLELKMEGEDILSVQEIKRRSKTLSSDYMHIKTVKEGSIIICLDVESSAFTSLGFFLELIETLLSTVLQRNHDSNNDSTSCVIISLDFMDTNNESLVFRKPLSDRKELMGSFPQIKEERELLHEENMRRIFMYDRQEFDLCLHDIARYLNVGNSLCTLQTEHAYVSSNKRRERRNEYERPNKMAKLLIEDEGNLMAKMSNVDDMVLQTTVDNCTSPAARITPIYSDKSVPERVQIKQEPKNDSEDSEDVCDCGIFHKTFDSLQIFEQHKRKCRAERQKDYGKPNKNAKLFIEDEVSLMAKMSNVNDMVLQTPVKNFTSTAARITIYSDKSVPERVQIKQEPKSEFVVRHTTATQMMYIRDDDKDRRLKTDLQTIIDNEVRIFLIGKCGAGRSATGNTLLGENKFPSGLSPQPVTLQFCFGTKNYKSRNIIVVDGPGLIFDSNFTAENMKKELAKATALLAPGPNAFLFVVGLNKFGESEMKAIEMYKKAFGEELMNYLIVVYTEGDTLERNNLSIQDYVLKFEDGRVKSLFASCENRYCSINNVGTAYIKERDANNLLDMIFALEKQNERKIYQNSQFIIAEKEIDKRLKERVNKSPKSLNYDDLLNLRASARNEILQGASWVNALIGTLILGFGAAFAYFIGGPGAVVAGAAIFSRYAAKK